MCHVVIGTSSLVPSNVRRRPLIHHGLMFIVVLGRVAMLFSVSWDALAVCRGWLSSIVLVVVVEVLLVRTLEQPEQMVV